MRGMFVICDGSDRRQSIGTLDELPEGWLQLQVTRRDGEAPEQLDFQSYLALAEWATRQDASRAIHLPPPGRRQA